MINANLNRIRDILCVVHLELPLADGDGDGANLKVLRESEGWVRDKLFHISVQRTSELAHSLNLGPRANLGERFCCVLAEDGWLEGNGAGTHA